MSRRIALGKRLRSCASIETLGVRTEWHDYTPEDRANILAAEALYYVSPVYEPIFLSLGKTVFPRNYYDFLGNKIQQTNLFTLLEIPHPRTRIYRGRGREARILRDFHYPFVAKTPLGASQGRGVFLIQDEDSLGDYLQVHPVAYIQEYLPIDRDLRVVLIGGHVVHAYWRIHKEGDFRNNVSQGGRISFEGIPGEALDFARDIVDKCGFHEVGLDVCHVHGRYCVLEANMVYGLEGFHAAGLDIHDIFQSLDEEGRI